MKSRGLVHVRDGGRWYEMVGEERRGRQWEKLDESEGNFDLKITYLIFFRVFTNNRERGTRRMREGGNERKKERNEYER